MRRIALSFLAWFLSASVCWAYTEFYVDCANGSDNNSGDAASVSVTATDGVCDGTTTYTSATGGFTGMASRYININTKDTYKISSVTNDTTIVLTRTCAAGTGLTHNIGGELVTIQEAENTFSAESTTNARVNIEYDDSTFECNLS